MGKGSPYKTLSQCVKKEGGSQLILIEKSVQNIKFCIKFLISAATSPILSTLHNLTKRCGRQFDFKFL